MFFTIGTRVCCVGELNGKPEVIGKKGTVLAIIRNAVLVEFDEPVNGLKVTPRGKPEHTWWFPALSDYLIFDRESVFID